MVLRKIFFSFIFILSNVSVLVQAQQNPNVSALNPNSTVNPANSSSDALKANSSKVSTTNNGGDTSKANSTAVHPATNNSDALKANSSKVNTTNNGGDNSIANSSAVHPAANSSKVNTTNNVSNTSKANSSVVHPATNSSKVNTTNNGVDTSKANSTVHPATNSSDALKANSSKVNTTNNGSDNLKANSSAVHPAANSSKVNTTNNVSNTSKANSSAVHPAKNNSEASKAESSAQNKNPHWPKGFTEICDEQKPSPEVWKKRNISGFIKKYPGSDKLNVMDFALSNGVMNFKCGLGETCDAGQICGPIPGPVWHILQAVQVWNNIQEQLNKAVNFASTSVSTIGATLSIDMYKPQMDHVKKLFKISDILTMVVSVVSLIISAALLIFPFTTAMGVAIGMSSAVALSQAGTALAAQNAFNGLKSDAFSRWSTFSGAIAAWQTDMQASAKKESDRVLKTAIGDDKGFHGVIGNGTYFVNKLEINTFDMEKNLRNVVKYRLLNSIFNGMNAFVTIDRDKCDHGGPGGGFKLEEGWLSHCKDGWMRNIIYPKGKKAGNKIYNAALIPTKYETSVEYIVDQSENCQRKYGWRHDPYKDSTLPKSPDGECIFNLPICYVGEHKAIRKAIRRHGTVRGCRSVQKLPI